MRYQLSLEFVQELDEALNEAIKNNNVREVNSICNKLDYYYNNIDLITSEARDYMSELMFWF